MLFDLLSTINILHTIDFDNTNFQLVDNALYENSIPKFLYIFAPPFDWKTIQVEEITKNKGDLNTKNIYLGNNLLKRHNPNEIFRNVHEGLGNNHFFAFKIITAENVKSKLQTILPNSLIKIYYPLHFFIRRVIPKMKGFRKISRLLNLPIDMSKSEIMGRLIYQGFNIISLDDSNEETIIIAKVNPAYNPSLIKAQPSEGILFKMLRLGKNAEQITVYKLRSMHPYAEYVQEYIYLNHGLDVGGKFKNDFRVSTGGKFIRKYWIDELPMIINLIKGDIKLIGVRPISEHYFNLYPESLKSLRVKTKPGLLPPFYADMPKTFEEIIQSELTYLKAYQNNPFRTDFKYLIKIIKNIFINRVRSK